jgi:hypothetical protein
MGVSMSIQQVLAAAISSWLNAKPNRSLHVLSRLTTASYSSVRRAAQGEVEQEQSTVVAIASVVMSEEDLRSFLRNYYPTLERAVIDVRGPDVRLDDANDNETSVIDFLKSDEHSKILILANSRTGTNDEEVSRKYGENYLSYFEDIKKSGILRYNEGSWFFDGSVGNVSQVLARKVICNLAKEFDGRNDSIHHASYSYLLWESLNKDGLEKVYRCHASHAKEVYDICSDPANHGDILTVFGLLHNVLKGQEGLA